MLYHPNSEHSRIVDEYVSDFKRTQEKEIELLSLETRDGADAATLYDITKYPAILVIKNDGQLLKHWEGEDLPMMKEVSAYDN